MNTKKEIEAKAKALLDSNPDEAVKLYRQIWENYPNQFNEWDAFYTIKAMRASNSPNLNWAKELAEKFKVDKVGSIYGWLIYDKCVKGKTEKEILLNEKYISSLITLTPQKNSKEGDKYPCPKTISILEFCKALKSQNKPSHAHQMDKFLSALDYDLLSDEPRTFNTKQGKVEVASPLEDYLALKTYALLELEKYQECKDMCKLAFERIKKFHYDNEIWFKRRIAQSEIGLGNHHEAEKILKELLESKAGSDKWFIYRDIAELYFKLEDFTKALKYSVDAVFYGNEPHFLIDLYYLQALILHKLNRTHESKILVELIAAILKERNWKGKDEYRKLFSYYKIDSASLRSVNEIIKEARKFWEKERYGNKPKLQGTVISIHKNGKVGRIKDQNNNIIEFHKKDLVDKMKSIESLNGATVEFYLVELHDGKKIAENIYVISKPKLNYSENIVGKVIEAVVVGISEFGVFFELELEGIKKGLLHKSNIPEKLRENLNSAFPKGKKVKVRVDKITDKGIQLKLADGS